MITTFIEYLKESKFTSKKTYKKGDIVETSKGVKYYINGVPPELESIWKQASDSREYEFARRKINIVYSKHFTEDNDVAAQCRSWFDDKKQPSESQVRNAMIWGYDQYGDYEIKSGGGSRSDSTFISNMKTTIANPKTGEDQDVVVLKKFSNDFKDVLIYIDEIQELQDLTETQDVRTARRTDNLRGIISILIRHEAGWSVSDKKKTPEEWINNLYKELKEEYRKEEIDEYLTKIEDNIKEDMGREIMKYDDIKKDFIPVEMKDKDVSSDNKRLGAIRKIREKI
jgi:hypothetical protein